VGVKRIAVIAVALGMLVVPGALALDINADAKLPPAEVGTYYEFEFEGEEGCIQSYYTRFSSGSLPPGLEVTSDLKLMGTPTQSGSFAFYVELADRGCPDVSVPSQGRFELLVLPDLAVATTSLPPATVRVPYSFMLQMSGFEGGYDAPHWLIKEGALPSGLSISPDGMISGTPTTVGATPLVIRIDEPFRRSGERAFTFNVVDPLGTTQPSRRLGEVGVPFSSQLRHQGGLAPVTWKVTNGSLPRGLALDAATGRIGGRPAAAGAFPLAFGVADAAGSTARVTTRLTIATRLVVLTRELPSAEKLVRYRQRLTAGGGVRPVTWTIVEGKLPPGVRLDRAKGLLTGVPSKRGTFAFTVQATDRLGGVATRKLALDIVQA